MWIAKYLSLVADYPTATLLTSAALLLLIAHLALSIGSVAITALRNFWDRNESKYKPAYFNRFAGKMVSISPSCSPHRRFTLKKGSETGFDKLAADLYYWCDEGAEWLIRHNFRSVTCYEYEACAFATREAAMEAVLSDTKATNGHYWNITVALVALPLLTSMFGVVIDWLLFNALLQTVVVLLTVAVVAGVLFGGRMITDINKKVAKIEDK